MRFSKPPLSHDAQLDLLQQRGLVIDDRRRALHYLSQLNYYRLGAYWLPFESDHNSHEFHSGTTFEQVLNLYIFDRELRLLVAQWFTNTRHRAVRNIVARRYSVNWSHTLSTLLAWAFLRTGETAHFGTAKLDSRKTAMRT